MNFPAIQRAFIGALPSQDTRPFRLYWRASQADFSGLLFLQRLDIREDLCGGVEGRLSCLSTANGIALQNFLGQPVTIQLVTDKGTLQSICAIVTDAHEGESDGSLSTYQLVVRDALSILERRVNTRIFRTKSTLDIIQTLVREWRSRSTTLAGTFDIDVSRLDASKYPVREQTLQFDESDADFIRRLCRREGIAWFVKAGGGQGASDLSEQPFHTLVLFDNVIKLEQAPAGTVSYRADATVGMSDSITLLTSGRQLVAGSVRRVSWDYKPSQMETLQGPTRVDQGAAGNDLARLLSDARIDAPHIADSPDDNQRLGRARLMAHDAQAVRMDGASGVRDLGVGTWVAVTGHPELDQLPVVDRRVIVTSLHHRGENNLPKDLNERAQSLFTASRWLFDSPPASVGTRMRPATIHDSEPSRYENTFAGVPRGTPLTPMYDPRADLPRVYPITGVVVVPDGEEVHCDEYGRIFVQIQGLDETDHAHASGAGTNGTPADSAAVRVLGGWAGENYGQHVLPRAGMEVLLDFMNGDPDRMYVAGVFANGQNMPATFSRTGGLPGNRYLTGMRSKEIQGQRYNQLRLDDTPSQISAQLASEHAYSQLNLGYLTQPRSDGKGADRGEGAELRTDAAAAVRAAQGILLTTYARTQASGNQLDRNELIQLLGECADLFKALGDYAGQHGGQAADVTGQTAVADAFKNWSPGAGSSGGSTTASTSESQALMALGAQAGSVNLTPRTHVTYAGQNIDQVAQQHVQLMSGQRLNATAGQGMQLFARGTGIQAVSGEGPVLLQAQADALTANAQKGVTISTNENEVLVTAPTIRFVAQDGSYIKLGGGVTLGTNGDIKLLSASHQWGGPSTQSAPKSAFNNQPTDQQFRLHYPANATGETVPAAHKPYRITLDDGSVIEGKTDANGLTSVVKDDAMRILKIDILKQGS
ncbi:type VI secretion system Vgr family protein [Paraburkholderia pallida]|uniref:Type VI secretion system tip protein VgrG n=1 Tax=Paraburkholderia pallida TaxID=2547399 RepID=A0A4P7CT28_9BURK|nr:type VI secretion system Vgr family protein [Paraburkholderia pallida]QBQ99105.1 type VI secretion system tip protein VgrG [Paraburkholderia pallida]